jgi:membrane associated rhomboid family serine protease
VNMLGLFFIGPAVERTVGSYRFFVLYYISGVLGGLGWSLLADPYVVYDSFGRQVLEYPVCVGASGAIMGMLGAFAALYPNAQLLLWFIIPVRAWVLVLILAIWELSETIGHPKIGGIANAAHLIGGIAGFTYALTLKHPHLVADLKSRFPGFLKGAAKPKPRPQTRQDTLSKEEVDRILDKIGKQGMGALTPRERELLKRATRG